MRVARVHVIALVVDAVVGLTLGLIARVIIVVLSWRFRSHFSKNSGILFTPPVGDGKLLLAVTEF